MLHNSVLWPVHTVIVCSHQSREWATGLVLFLSSLLFPDTEEIVKKLNQNQRVKKQNITARCLELTKSVRAENIPPNTPSDYITIYFESKKNGGAQVVDVQQLHDEGAAVITFSDHKGNAEMQKPYFL